MSSIFELAKGVQLSRSDLLHRASKFVEARRAGGGDPAAHDSNRSIREFPTVVVGSLVRVFDGDLDEGENADENTTGSSAFRIGSIISVLEISTAAKDEDLETECCFAVEFGYKREAVVELRYISNQMMDVTEHDLFAAECAKMHFCGAGSSGAPPPPGSSRLLLSTEELLNLRKLLGKNTGNEAYVSKRNTSGKTEESKQQTQGGSASALTSGAAGRDELIRRLLEEKRDLQKQLRDKDGTIRQFALKSHTTNEEAMAASQAEIQQLKAKNEQLVKEQEETQHKLQRTNKVAMDAINREKKYQQALFDFFKRKSVAPRGKTAVNLKVDEIPSILEKL